MGGKHPLKFVPLADVVKISEIERYRAVLVRLWRRSRVSID
jgi:hypothetical protein